MGCLVVVLAAAMLTCAGGAFIKVGGREGWTQNVNYTDWAAHRHFYVGDWLYFIFDKRYYSVLEVNQTNYEHCIDVGFIKNITKGGRDVYNLTESRPYYFLSSGGYCFHGMKVAIHVYPRAAAVPPSPAPSKNGASPKTAANQIIIFLVFFLSLVVQIL